MTINNPYYFKWLEVEKKEWLSLDNPFNELANGLESPTRNKSAFWDEEVFLTISPFILTESTDYLYTYRYSVDVVSNLFIDFEHDNINIRFIRQIREKNLILSLSYKTTKTKFYRPFTKLKKIQDHFINLPEFRIKLLTGETILQNEEVMEFLDYNTTKKRANL